ncbi:MAG: YitT family protein, partial [Amnibacterium sp.]
GYALHVPFGPVFLVVNLPFLALAVWKRGWAFALRTLLAVALVSAWAGLHPLVADVVAIAPVYGTLTGNLLAGLGILILFRHKASLGGLNTLALLAQDLLGLRAGAVQLCFDAVIVALSLTVAPPPMVLLSAIGAAVLNLVLVMNHRPGRYVAG